jgi:hypothetical protein
VLHAGAGVLASKPRSSTFLLAEIGDGVGSRSIWKKRKGALDRGKQEGFGDAEKKAGEGLLATVTFPFSSDSGDGVLPLQRERESRG